MKKPIRILYLEDLPEDVELVKEFLAREYLTCEITWVKGRDSLKSALKDAWNYDLLLADYSLPDIGGDEALELAQELAPDVPFIFLAGSLGEERAVECLRQGATDYVLKTNLPRLAPVVRRALEEARQARARRAAEASHARVASLLRATLESTTEGILVVDLAGRVSAYNRKFMSLFGIPEYVMAPMEMDEVIHFLTDQFGNPDALLDEARLLHARSDKESSGVLSLKGNRVLEESGRPHKVGTETVGRVLSFREPLAREPAGDLLKAIGGGRQGFSEATLAARVVPWHMVEDRLIIPDAGETILGLSPLPGNLSELVDLIHSEDVDLLQEALERARNVSFKVRMRGPGSAWRWIRWNLDRGPDGYRGVFMDVTEQEWLQERMFLRKRMEGAREMARRVAGKFHDHVTSAAKDLQALNPSPAQEPILAEALASLREADGFLDQLRNFAHVGRPYCVPVRPNEFIEGVLQKARQEAGPALQIEFAPGENLPDVRLDPTQMELALTALLDNASQAQGGVGLIQVATGLLAPRPYRPGGKPGPMKTRVLFEVKDPGPGIPPGIQKQIFEPFFTTRLESGRTGLGLAIVREIVEGHEGSIQVESPPGKGTVMRILLPA